MDTSLIDLNTYVLPDSGESGVLCGFVQQLLSADIAAHGFSAEQWNWEDSPKMVAKTKTEQGRCRMLTFSTPLGGEPGVRMGGSVFIGNKGRVKAICVGAFHDVKETGSTETLLMDEFLPDLIYFDQFSRGFAEALSDTLVA